MPFTCLNLPCLLLGKKKDRKRRIVIGATLSILYQLSCANFPISLLFTPPNLTFPQEYSLYEPVASLGSILGLAMLEIGDRHLLKKKKKLIYFAMPGLSCDMQDLQFSLLSVRSFQLWHVDF